MAKKSYAQLLKEQRQKRIEIIKNSHLSSVDKKSKIYNILNVSEYA